MATAKEIRGKISSVKSTQKITRAMELVAASKLRKSQQRMALSKPYATKIQQIIGHLAGSSTEYKHPFLQKREKISRVGYVIVSSDRGLCGPLNTALFRQILTHMRVQEQANVSIDLCPIGSKAMAFFKRTQHTIVGHADHLGDQPAIADLIGVVKTMLTAFTQGKIDAVYLCANRFINTMKLEPYVHPLLPLEPTEDSSVADHHWDYLYEPDAKALLDMLLNRYIESQVYQAVIENIACEQAARMVAMKSATDNAANIISDLQLVYNKARQAAITSELSEIVAGAAAVQS